MPDSKAYEVVTDAFYREKDEDKPDFRTLGVPFHNGRAIVDEDTVPERYGRSVETVAREMKSDYHYAVKEVGHRTVWSVPEMPWKRPRGMVSVEGWETLSVGQQVLHDEFGPVIVRKLNKASARLETIEAEGAEGEMFLERSIDTLMMEKPADAKTPEKEEKDGDEEGDRSSTETSD